MVVGTSGWQYRDWRGVLYPAGVPTSRWLEQYASTFAAVENNATFYRLPAPETFAAWRDRTPDGFLMVVKASRYLTHVRRLRDPAEPVARLLGSAARLGSRLGGVLVQLPPNMPADTGALEVCLREFAGFRPEDGAARREAAPAKDGGSRLAVPVRVAVEFRHDSWWTDQTRDILARYNAALCWADSGQRAQAPLWHTADWGYLRLHEGAGSPWPRYAQSALRRWVKKVADTWQRDEDVFVFFNNDQHGAAPKDAAAFAATAKRAGQRVYAIAPD
jgi:uncharacterized protein YecE (DUF72 family)